MALVGEVKARLVLQAAVADPLACASLGVAVTTLKREHWTVEAFGQTQSADVVGLDILVAEFTRAWSIDAPEMKDANQVELFRTPGNEPPAGGEPT